MRLARYVTMLGRKTPRLMKQFAPPVIGFILGYIWRCLDVAPQQEESSLENVSPTFYNNLRSCSSDKLFSCYNVNLIDVLQELPLFTGPSVSLLILVLSSPSNVDVRNTIRQTWLSVSKKNHNYQAFFVVGDRGLNNKQVYDLAGEKSRHSDLLVLSMHDTYSDLTKKLVKSLEFAHKNFRFDYVLKCDDDTFVDVERVVEELKVAKDPFLYWGFFDGRAPVQIKGKWADNSYKLCDKYIPYALGGGYVLGRELVKFISENSRLLELYNSEDVTVGAWLAGLKVNRKHDVR